MAPTNSLARSASSLSQRDNAPQVGVSLNTDFSLGATYNNMDLSQLPPSTPVTSFHKAGQEATLLTGGASVQTDNSKPDQSSMMSGSRPSSSYDPSKSGDAGPAGDEQGAGAVYETISQQEIDTNVGPELNEKYGRALKDRAEKETGAQFYYKRDEDDLWCYTRTDGIVHLIVISASLTLLGGIAIYAIVMRRRDAKKMNLILKAQEIAHNLRVEGDARLISALRTNNEWLARDNAFWVTYSQQMATSNGNEDRTAKAPQDQMNPPVAEGSSQRVEPDAMEALNDAGALMAELRESLGLVRSRHEAHRESGGEDE